jgi:hypothetical protein
VLQSCLQEDLQDLDSQIEQLERAAESQKIFSEVVDHTVAIPEYFDSFLQL